jgi:hypothetical protein
MNARNHLEIWISIFCGFKLPKPHAGARQTLLKLKFKIPFYVSPVSSFHSYSLFCLELGMHPKKALFLVGRLPLEEMQPYVAETIPAQDEEGRYESEVPENWVNGDLMFHIRNAQGMQDNISFFLRRRPKKPFTFVPVWTPLEIENRIRARNWVENAWGAGSHTGYDTAVLNMNVKMGLEQYRPAYEAAMTTVAALQNADDGMWGGVSSEPYTRVNGTMKLICNIHFIQECHLPFADKVIDYMLDYCDKTFPTYMDKHGAVHLCCSLIDVMFCIEYAMRMTDHRRDEIRNCVYNMFPLMEQIANDEEASLGLAHGAIRRAAAILDLKDELSWPQKVYRFPDA